MPQFKRPDRGRTGGGFEKPAEAPKTGRQLLKKEESVEAHLTINDLHINEELMGQPLLMRTYTKELASLRKKVKSIENKLELTESRLRTKFSSNGKGLKVAEVDALIVEDVEVQTLRVELYDAEEQQDQFEGVVKAIAQRYEMLKELCANLRKEMV